MMIDWTHFTPYSATLGGLIIGVAVALLLLFNGKIAGISGIIYNLFKFKSSKNVWQLAFLLGLLLSPLVWNIFAKLPVIEIDTSFPTLIISGVLVGLGTAFANGCTSGHGICGIARLSKRSIVATLIFMIAGILTVYVINLTGSI